MAPVRSAKNHNLNTSLPEKVLVSLTTAQLGHLDRLSGGKWFRATYLRQLLDFAIENDIRLRPRPIATPYPGEGRHE